MTVPARLKVTLAVVAMLALVIGANWQFADLAFRSQPGCVPESSDLPAAKPGC